MKRYSKSTFILKLALFLFISGFIGIVITSLGYTLPLAKEIFLLSSFVLGASLFVFLFIDVEKNSRGENLFLILLFASAIVKAFAIHLKYGIFLSADASAEETVIRGILSSGFLGAGIKGLLATPLSMIHVALSSLFTGITPLNGIFNIIHLITGAIIPVTAYVLIRNSFNTKIAILSSIVLAYSPPNVFVGLSMTRENFGLLFFMLSLILIVGRLNSMAHLATLIFLFFSLIFSHYTTTYFAFLVFLIIFSVIALYHIKEKEYKKSFLMLSPFIVGVFVLYIWLLNSPSHYGDLSIATDYVMGTLNFLTFKTTFNTLHYESIALLTGTSLIELLYKFQGLIIIAGAIVLSREISRQKLSKNQATLAVICLPMTLMAILWVVVPDLSISLPPHRALRYTSMVTSLGVGFLLYPLFNSTKVRFRIAITVVALFLYTFPISGYISDILVFSPGEYPSELNNNMYNIMSIREIEVMGSVNEFIAGGSNVIAEFPVARALEMHPDKAGKISFMRNNTWENPPRESIIIVRRALFSNGQFISYPYGKLSFVVNSPYVHKFKESEFRGALQEIEQNNVIYSQNDFKILRYNLDHELRIKREYLYNIGWKKEPKVAP